jgi:hypothetical protein
VDLDLGPAPLRTEALRSVTLATDGAGARLARPAKLLVAARWSPNQTVLVRDDATGRWVESEVFAGGPLAAGGVFTARSFTTHRDRVTGVDSLYAGTWSGGRSAVGRYDAAIRRAVHDPAAPGGLRWAAQPELAGTGRVMAFAECNGDLYAACCIRDASPGSGGIFRRIDGPSPRWEPVYRWKEFDLNVWDDEQRMIRGLASVPDPGTPGREVLIGFRYYPRPVIERIDPQKGHAATVELDLCDFFGRAFHGGGRYVGPIRCAYTPFTPFTDPRTGERVHLAGVQIYHPGFPDAPHNGSHYLVRRLDGTCDWAPVFDAAHPVPAGRSLDATRQICVSPFPEDAGRVLYFAGYDGPYAENRSAWIYRAEAARQGNPPGATNAPR